MTHRWVVEHRIGRAGELHAAAPPDDPVRTVRRLVVERPALVLGSGQPVEVVDGAAAAAAGVEVARRRSGGGAVLLVPEEHEWFDLWLPADDPLRDEDVVRGAEWVGQAWASAARALGFREVTIHRGRQTTEPWARLVCFAGRGPGEVSVGGRKLVGVSQRRSRAWLRVQTMLHRRWDPDATPALLREVPPGPLDDAVATVGGLDVEPALLAALPD